MVGAGVFLSCGYAVSGIHAIFDVEQTADVWLASLLAVKLTRENNYDAHLHIVSGSGRKRAVWRGSPDSLCVRS